MAHDSLDGRTLPETQLLMVCRGNPMSSKARRDFFVMCIFMVTSGLL
jgi:hypothetical protein